MPSSLLETYHARCHTALPYDAVPFWIDARPMGVITKSIQATLSNPLLSPYFERNSNGVSLVIHDESVTQTLVRVAHHFQTLGVLLDRRSEELDVTTGDGEIILGHAQRGLFRTLGMATTCVYAIGQTQDKRIIVSRRSAKKAIGPGLWDLFAAGLVSAGEKTGTAMQREIAEETGLTPNDYTIVGSVGQTQACCEVSGGWLMERGLTHLLLLKDPSLVHNVDGEVDSFSLLHEQEVLQIIEKEQMMPEAAYAYLNFLTLRKTLACN